MKRVFIVVFVILLIGILNYTYVKADTKDELSGGISVEDFDLSEGSNVLRRNGYDEINIKEIEDKVNKMIEKDIPIQYYDEKHVKIGDFIHPCSGPRIHVDSTSKIEHFKLLPKLYYDSTKKVYMLVGLVGDKIDESYKDLNKI